MDMRVVIEPIATGMNTVYAARAAVGHAQGLNEVAAYRPVCALDHALQQFAVPSEPCPQDHAVNQFELELGNFLLIMEKIKPGCWWL